MSANLVLALLSKHPHLMYIELAVVTHISPSIANLSYIPKAASLPFSYLVIVLDILVKKSAGTDFTAGTKLNKNSSLPTYYSRMD
ncbi:Bgt-51452 [Blumeria graminis f. sp. tritici]|uniref:Bgt-51452 n=1 Tax=Blumeria graminis f. sp. tritici TaxID=62690 RepID=A0A9X9MEF9_BLUGR|nr:Bgt-51452 [Blumeria graminis f. sp. tritici]